MKQSYFGVFSAAAMIVSGLGLAQTARANCTQPGTSTFTSILNAPDTPISPYPAPYGTVNVDLLNPTTACITFTSGSSGAYTYLFIDSSSADVQVNATSFTEAFSSATGPSTGGFVAPSFVGFGSGNVDNRGTFNLTTDMFDGTDHAANDIEFTVTNTSGTWASASNVLTTNSSGFDAAAHVVVFNSTSVVNGTQLATGYVGEVPTITPEPTSVFLLGTCVIGIGAILGRRRIGRRLQS